MPTQLSIFDILEPAAPKVKKTYTPQEIRQYITNKEPVVAYNTFYNIALSQTIPSWNSTIEPAEHLEYFKQLKNGFCYHLFNDKVTIFSLKHKHDNSSDEYSIFIHIHGDLILELPRVKDILNDELSAPACAIWWYNEDGTPATTYLTYNNESEKEKMTEAIAAGQIKKPTGDNAHEWIKDRREYYFLYLMEIKKYAKGDRVTKMNYDTFVNFTWKLKDMYEHFKNKYGGE